MKRWLCLALVGVLLLCCTACNGESASSANPPSEGGNDTNLSALSLDEAYAYASERYKNNPNTHRDIGELQSETQQIIEMDGKYYQSYVSSNVDIRYVFISAAEFPEGSHEALWDWFNVGTTNIYSLELLGKIDEGHK